MRSQEWQRKRSDFNHGWLKNRLIVGLIKCLRVVEGRVGDQNMLQAMSDLLDEWPRMRSRIEEVLAFAESFLSAPIPTDASDVAWLGEENCAFLLEVERQIWLGRDHVDRQLLASRMAVVELNDALCELHQPISVGIAPTKAQVEGCLTAARELATHISRLSVPRDQVLC